MTSKSSRVTPGTILPKLNTAFLEEQNDEWMCRLYEFLNGQTALRRQAANLPLIRLTTARMFERSRMAGPWRFFPAILRRTSQLSEPPYVIRRAPSIPGFTRFDQTDPVDDVIRNILCKYEDARGVGDDGYADDIRRILNAFRTDSRSSATS